MKRPQKTSVPLSFWRTFARQTRSRATKPLKKGSPPNRQIIASRSLPPERYRSVPQYRPEHASPRRTVEGNHPGLFARPDLSASTGDAVIAPLTACPPHSRHREVSPATQLGPPGDRRMRSSPAKAYFLHQASGGVQPLARLERPIAGSLLTENAVLMSQDRPSPSDPERIAAQRTARLDLARQAPPAPEPPRVIGGRYELLEMIGQGGAARVYRARDGVLDRIVAVKLLRAEYGADQEFVARFYQEARAVASLSHPNIVDIYDYGSHDGTYFIVMQYVEGTDLKALLRREGRLAPPRAVAFADGALRALSAAHEHGIIHRDVKPQNLLVRARDGVVKLTDFGVARALGNAQVTAAGTTFGTAHYMAPEQAEGGVIGPATDLYAVGVILYEALAGRLPYQGTTPLQVILQHLRAPLPALTEFAPEVAPALVAVVERALAKDPLARYPSAEVMRQALNAALTTGQPAPTLPDPAMRTQKLPPMPTRNGASTGTSGTPPGARRPVATAPTARRGTFGCLLPLLGILILALTVALVAVARGFGSAARPEATTISGVLPEPTRAAVALSTATAIPTAPAATNTPPPPTSTPPPPTAAPTRPAAPVVILPTMTPVPPTATALPPTATPLPPSPAPPPPAPTVTPTPKPQPTTTPTPRGQGGGNGNPTQISAFSPDQLQGAYRRDDGTLYGLPATALYGDGSGYNQGTIVFTVQSLPGQRLVLVLTGLDDERNDHCLLQVVLNGVIVFDGQNTFRNTPSNDNGVGGPSRYWSQMTIALPPNTLREGSNTLTLRNRTPGTRPGIPYILINNLTFTTDR